MLGQTTSRGFTFAPSSPAALLSLLQVQRKLLLPPLLYRRPRKGTKTVPLVSVQRVVRLIEDQQHHPSQPPMQHTHPPKALNGIALVLWREKIRRGYHLGVRSPKKRMGIPVGVEPTTNLVLDDGVPLNRSLSSMSSTYSSSYLPAYPTISSYSGLGSLSTYTYGIFGKVQNINRCSTGVL